jgi:hypothetical protein
MTTLEQLEVKPEIVRELQSQCIDSVEDLLTLSAQPDERRALLQDMKWTEPQLQALLEAAHRIVPEWVIPKRFGSTPASTRTGSRAIESSRGF